MKTHTLPIVCSITLFSACAQAQMISQVTNLPPQFVAYDQKADKGPHHRIVRNLRPATRPGGQVSSSYVELTTGMHYRDANGQWQETEEKIELFKNAAMALNGPHKVIFNANANSAGAVDLEMADGQRVRSHVLGLSVYDPASGNSQRIAEVKDCVGQLLPPNQIIYPDALDSIRADLLYLYTKRGLEQFVILRENPVLPKGFDPANCRLEVVTEFEELPPVQKSRQVLKREPDEQKRRAMVEPDFVDERLDLGAMTIGAGRAFDLAQEQGNGDAQGHPHERGVRVGKRLEVIQHRNILFEAVEWQELKQRLDKLPKQRAALEQKRPDRQAAAFLSCPNPSGRLSSGPP